MHPTTGHNSPHMMCKSSPSKQSA